MVVQRESVAQHFTGFSGRTVGGNFCQLLLQISGCFPMVKRFKLITDSSKIQTKKLDPDLKVGVCLLVYFLFEQFSSGNS